MRGRVKIRGLVRDPFEEGGDILARPQRLQRGVEARQLLVGNIGMDRAMADRMERQSLASAAALGHDMVPFDAAAERTAA